MLENARVCARGYMDQRALLAALDRARHGCEPLSSPLLATICLELWLRAFDEGGLVRNTGTHGRENVASQTTVSVGAVLAGNERDKPQTALT